ncbi:MAG: class I SAM-dependent methyltransferase [Pseudomonadota bacterium]
MEYAAANRDIWNADAPNWVERGRAMWHRADPVWGCWDTHEAQVQMLPADMTGMNAVELGCGTGYVSAWMARRGATVTAIDLSPEQLATARALHAKDPLDITFLEANAEQTGLPDAAFDFAISEYGASIWCPAEAWLAEAARLLKPGSTLVFLGNHPLSLICAPLSGAPADRILHRPYRDMWGADWRDVEIEPTGICFNLTFQGWMDVFARCGFTVQGYKELYARPDAEGIIAAVPADWAKDYPVKQVWWLRRA